jgi:osmotically-inducible protein OsmY
MKTDSLVQADIMQELSFDPKVNHEHIGVAVSGGVATLSGQVPTYFEKLAAEKAAKRVAGVSVVVEKIEVKLPLFHRRDDQDIAKAILTQFKWDTQVPDLMIKASVENGMVELTGEVEWDFQRRAAQKSIRSLAGITSITNNITLQKKSVQPSEIKQRIEAALKREAEKDARHIAVEVNGTKVTLTGKVGSFAEAEDARFAAWCTPGVSKVENRLSVSW